MKSILFNLLYKGLIQKLVPLLVEKVLELISQKLPQTKLA